MINLENITDYMLEKLLKHFYRKTNINIFSIYHLIIYTEINRIFFCFSA